MKLALAAVLCLAPAQEPVLRVCWGPPTHLDPHRAVTAAEARLAGALFEGLTAPGADGVTAVPGMAERWETSADGRVWTFALREARWSNGDPVTAQDFVGSWKRALRVDTGCAFTGLFRVIRNVGPWLEAAEADFLLTLESPPEGRLSGVARKRHAAALRKRGLEKAAAAAESRPDVEEKDLGFSAADGRTLRVTLERRAPWLPELLTFAAFAPVPEKVVAAHGEGWVKPERIVTNGAYRFEGATPVEITLKRNPAYWDGAAAGAPERITVVLTDEEGAVRKFREGRVDWVAGEMLPSPLPEELKEAVTYDVWGTYFLLVNSAKPPFDRAGVRTAVARALDRGAAAKAAGLRPAAGLVPEGFPGYRGAKGPAFDRAAAMEALLRETEFDLSKLPRLEILSVDATPYAALGRAVAGQLEKHLGLRVRSMESKWGAYSKALGEGESALALGVWRGDFFDPASFLEGWSGGEEFDALVRSAAGEADGARRLETLARAEEKLLGLGVVIPLAAAADAVLVREKVKGVGPNLLGRAPLKFVRVGK